MKKIQSLEDRLASLVVGERSWFWFSPDTDDIPLLMERFADPRGMDRLLRRAASLPLPAGARVCTGISAVNAAGELSFGSPVFTEDMLGVLARWVQAHLPEHPALAHLSGASFLRTDSSGTVQARYTDAALWAGISAPARPGTLEAAQDTLSALEAGEDVWVWLSEGQSAPLVVAVPIHEDPEGTAFGALVLAGRARSGRRAAGLRGTARRLNSGGLLVSTADPLERVGPQLEGWLTALGEVRLVQLVDGEAVAGRRLGGAAVGTDFSGQAAALAAIQGGATYAFWFTDAARDGQPLLLLEESRDALKSLAQEASGSGASMRGQITAARWGLEFRAQKIQPDFLAALARWVEANHRQWPALLALVDARATLRDREGEVLQRFKDDNLWAPLRGKRS